jgi:hypothetical protein
VIQCLYEKGIASLKAFTKRDVIQNGQWNSVKWLVDHGVIQDQQKHSLGLSIMQHNLVRLGPTASYPQVWPRLETVEG